MYMYVSTAFEGRVSAGNNARARWKMPGALDPNLIMTSFDGRAGRP
jgi:hypothetical protein